MRTEREIRKAEDGVLTTDTAKYRKKTLPLASVLSYTIW